MRATIDGPATGWHGGFGESGGSVAPAQCPRRAGRDPTIPTPDPAAVGRHPSPAAAATAVLKPDSPPGAVSILELLNTGTLMKPTAWFAALAAMTASCNALAVGDVAQVTIIDCSTGAVLTPHLHHGEYWVAGRPGTTYAIEIHNRPDERVLAVTCVDGVNVISGATAAWNQTGYVFRPQQDYRITGWRKSDDEVAAFTFTTSPNSYAARTGRPANVGVIGVAVFRERQQLNLPPPPPESLSYRE